MANSFQFLVIPIANKGFRNFKEQIFSFERICCLSKILFQRHFLSSARSCASCILGFRVFVMSLLRDVVFISLYVALVEDIKHSSSQVNYFTVSTSNTPHNKIHTTNYYASRAYSCNCRNVRQRKTLKH